MIEIALTERIQIGSNDALSDSDFHDYFGVIDTAINARLALIDGIAVRGAVLDVLLQEYETRFRAAVDAPGWTFI